MSRFSRFTLNVLICLIGGVMIEGSLDNAAEAQVAPVIWTNWINGLQAQGYTVSKGSALEFTTPYCLQNIYPYFNYCFASDPEDPYLQSIVPVGQGYIDPYFGPSSAETLPDGTVASDVYHLDPTEAVVVIVTLPPEAAYFSYESYVFTRPIAYYPNGVQSVSPDPARANLFASFNNSIDNVQILQQSGLTFGQGLVGFITTSNATLANALVSSFAPAGGDPKYLFVEQMGNTVNPGLDQTTDDFTTVVRYSIPQDNTAGNAWRKHASGNIQVYRIGQPAGMTVQRYVATPIRNKYYNTAESSHQATLNELSKILTGWLTTQENDSLVATHNTITSIKVGKNGTIYGGFFGPNCLASGTNCTSDQMDTDAYRSLAIGKLPAGRLFIVDGVDHTVTNNSTFVAVSASDSKRSIGVATASQTNPAAAGFLSGVLTGSAQTVLQTLGLLNQASPTLINDLPNLYVHLFTRPCTTQIFCSQTFTTTLTSQNLPYGDGVKMNERAYVLPGYFNGANPDFLVKPQVIY